jgi:hypothetical protein
MPGADVASKVGHAHWSDANDSSQSRFAIPGLNTSVALAPSRCLAIDLSRTSCQYMIIAIIVELVDVRRGDNVVFQTLEIATANNRRK